METVLITNGLIFSEDKFYEEYQKHPNTNIGISLKAANPKQFFEATSSNLFNQVQIGISRAIGLNGMVSLTYNTFYEKNLLELVDFATKCGSQTVKIDFCSVTFENDKPSAKYMVPPKRLVANIVRDYPRLCDSARNIIFEFQLPLCLFPDEFINTIISKKQIINVCHVHQRLGVIFDSKGGLLMCNSLFDYPMGYFMRDFETSDQLLNFMNSSSILDCQQQISRYPHDKCRNCDKYDICAGGCPLKWAIYKPESLLEGGDCSGTIKGAY